MVQCLDRGKLMKQKYFIEYNLQLFAKEGPGGEKTEEATAKKKEDTRKEGQVAKSKELVLGLSLAAFFISIKMFIGYVGENLIYAYQHYYSLIHEFTGESPTVQRYASVVNDVLLYMLKILAPFFVVAMVMAFLANKIQFKWMVTFKPLQPKLSKLNPINGFKRMFSKESLFELVKSVGKIGVIAYLIYGTIKNETSVLFSFYDMTIPAALVWMYDVIMDFGIKVSVAMIVIGIIDFVFQKRKHKQDIMMTKQEVKDEYKNSEGDPKIKSQIRAKMREASQRRMMHDIPKADVIITNPTHFAVALMYDANVRSAPIVLAKGADYVAGKIKEIGKENGIELVENKAVARMLYYNVEVGEEIPPELYQAVAEILAYVYKLKNKVN